MLSIEHEENKGYLYSRNLKFCLNLTWDQILLKYIRSPCSQFIQIYGIVFLVARNALNMIKIIVQWQTNTHTYIHTLSHTLTHMSIIHCLHRTSTERIPQSYVPHNDCMKRHVDWWENSSENKLLVDLSTTIPKTTSYRKITLTLDIGKEWGSCNEVNFSQSVDIWTTNKTS